MRDNEAVQQFAVNIFHSKKPVAAGNEASTWNSKRNAVHGRIATQHGKVASLSIDFRSDDVRKISA